MLRTLSTLSPEVSHSYPSTDVDEILCRQRSGQTRARPFVYPQRLQEEATTSVLLILVVADCSGERWRKDE